MSDPPTIIDADKDPIEVLRMMARFVSDNRGIAKIVVQTETNDHESLLIGYAVLCKQPEKAAVPIYECATRKVECVKLADWLLAHGLEVSAAEWRQLSSSVFAVQPESVRWELFIKRPVLQEMPPPLMSAIVAAGPPIPGGSGFHRAARSYNYGIMNHENGVMRRR